MSNRVKQPAATGPPDAIPPPDPAVARARLQIWLSPSFPVGAFAYSHGLERAVDAGWIRGRAGLEGWLADLVALGSLRNDLILVSLAWRHTTAADWQALAATADLAAALQPTAERHLEATQQGRSFLDHVEAVDGAPARGWRVVAGDAVATYATALGFAAAGHAIPLAETLAAFAVAFAGSLTSAAIRLSVIGQTDAQRIHAALLAQLLAAARMAETATLDDLGGAAWRCDIASAQHETQYTRLFRS